MALTEQDLDLLERYLDDALEAHEVEALEQRLPAEGELAAALSEARAQRRLRQTFFASLEPDEQAAGRVGDRVQHSIQRRQRFAGVTRSLRYIAAAAACLVIGFVARSAMDRPGATAPGNGGGIVAKDTSGVDVKAVAAYEVTLRDEAGRVVAVQRFDSLDKAQEFAGDLARWQARQERLASGKFVVRADRF